MKREQFGISKDIVSDIKKILTKKWDEKKKAEQSLTHKKQYDRMVDEAVLLIQTRWKRAAKYGENTEHPVDCVELEVYNVFFVTEDLSLYSTIGYSVENPATGRCCMFDIFVFESDEEKKQYIEDVLARLPEGTEVVRSKGKNFLKEDCETYTFKLHIKME